MVHIDINFIVLASVSVVGVIEWLKGLVPEKTPTWVWRVALLPVSALVSFAADGGMFQVVTNGLALLAVTQIAHPVLVQLPSAIVTAFKNRIGGEGK